MTLLKRSFTYLRPYLRLSLGAFFSMLLVTVANLAAPQLTRELIDNGITPKRWQGILIAAGGLLIVALVRGVFSFFNSYWSEKASQGIGYDLRNEVYRKLETLSFSYHDQHQTGQLMTRATSDVEAVRGFFAQGLFQFISAILTLIGSALILFFTDWRLALASLLTIPPIIFIFVYVFSRLGPRFGRVQQKLGTLNTVLQENIAGVYVVKAFAAEEHALALYRQDNEKLYEENLGIVYLASLGFPTVFLFANLGTLIVIWYGGNLVISEQLSLGTLIAFNSYLAFFLTPIFQMGMISQQLSRASASASRLFEVIDTENEIKERADATRLAETIPGQVIFENVSFRYTGTNEDVLSNISFTVEPGGTVAILGATGSGKSTLVNLIPRFYDVTSGSVYIDGHDVRDVTIESLRQRVGVVLQEVNLVHGTIRENIAYGKPDATEREIKRVARAAQAHRFIEAMPDGYESVIGERGEGLSGGQRQRIAIARTLLINPCVLIFDDSTSALDAETEYKIGRALAPLLAKQTAFIIAQRVSTARYATMILVMDKGQIVAHGRHEELLNSSLLYRDILYSQLEDDETTVGKEA